MLHENKSYFVTAEVLKEGEPWESDRFSLSLECFIRRPKEHSMENLYIFTRTIDFIQ